MSAISSRRSSPASRHQPRQRSRWLSRPLSRFPLSLKARIALITTALAAVLGTGIVLASLYYAHDDLRAALQAQQNSIVKLTADQLDTAIEERTTLLAHLSPQLRTKLDAPRAELLTLIARAVPIPESFDAAVVADAHGNLLLANDATVSIADRGYFREVARTKAPVVSGPIRSRTDGSFGVLVVVPILSETHALLGVLGGWLDLSSANILVQISGSRLGTNGFYCLVSGGPAPVYVQHPDPASARQPALLLGDTCGVSARPALFEFLTPHEPMISRHLMQTTGWELVAVLPASEAFSPLHAMQHRFLTLAVVALSIVALLIWLAVRRLLAPLTALQGVVRDSTQDMAAYARLSRSRDDEIGDVSRAFAQLMRDLHERRELLDRSEQRLRSVTDTLPSLLAFIDPEERYVFNNLAYERTYGIPVNALRGKTVLEVVGDRRYAYARPYLQQALAGTAVTYETEDNDPEYHCTETSLRPEWSADRGRVVGVHIHIQDVTARKLETLRLSRISRLDHLTQLLNRSAFETQLDEAMTRSREQRRTMALMYLDMDRFKAVNDYHGHVTGDLLLQAFGRRVQRCVREQDTVARLGGDEFAVILEDIAGPEAAARVADAILHAVSRRFFVDGVFADVDVSIGIALYRGEPIPQQALMRQADALLYRAKSAGRARYEMGPSEPGQDADAA